MLITKSHTFSNGKAAAQCYGQTIITRCSVTRFVVSYTIAYWYIVHVVVVCAGTPQHLIWNAKNSTVQGSHVLFSRYVSLSIRLCQLSARLHDTSICGWKRMREKCMSRLFEFKSTCTVLVFCPDLHIVRHSS